MWIHASAGVTGSMSVTPAEAGVRKVTGMQGQNNIASRLCLSVKTIETYRQHIMDKLDINSIAELIRFAIREGIICLDM